MNKYEIKTQATVSRFWLTLSLVSSALVMVFNGVVGDGWVDEGSDAISMKDATLGDSTALALSLTVP